MVKRGSKGISGAYQFQKYGMLDGRVAAEVKLGDRSVLEYLLSPIRAAFHEAGRER